MAEYAPICAACVRVVGEDGVYYDARLWHRRCLDNRKPTMKSRRKAETRVLRNLGLMADSDRSERRMR